MEKLLEKIEALTPEEKLLEMAKEIAHLNAEMEKHPEHSHEWSVLHGKVTHIQNLIAELEEKTWGLHTNGKKKTAA